MTEGNLVAAAVLSGNRNFEGRINPLVKANYLASPPLVVAYALAGTTDIDLATEPLGTDRDGRPVYLRDIWPTAAEVEPKPWPRAVQPEMFRTRYGNVFESQSAVERDCRDRRRTVPLGRRQHLHPGAAVPARTWPPKPGPIQPIRRRPGAGRLGRFA